MNEFDKLSSNDDIDTRIKLIPFRSILNLKYVRRKSFLWVFFFGVTPLMILYFSTFFDWKFERSAWLLGTYFCLIWGINFNLLIRSEPTLWRTGGLYALFTAFIGVPILLLLQSIGIIRLLYAGTTSEVYLVRVIGFIFGVGVLEETCKLLPVLVFGIRKNKIKTLRQALFLGTMSGLGFALAEAVHYTLMYWQGSAIISLSEAGGIDQDSENLIHNLTNYYGNIVVVQIVRFMTLPLFHAVWAGISSWFAGVAALYKPVNRKLIAFGVLIMAVVHGFYDVYSGTLRGIGIGILTIFIFMGYVTYSENIDRELFYKAKKDT